MQTFIRAQVLFVHGTQERNAGPTKVVSLNQQAQIAFVTQAKDVVEDATFFQIEHQITGLEPKSHS